MAAFRFLLLLTILSPLPSGGRTPERITVSDDITAVCLTDSIYLYTATAKIEGYGLVPSNGLIVMCRGEAILLDTPVNDAQTETLVGWIADSLHARVVGFVPNHWHSDCMGGLGYLHRRGVKSYASELTRDFAAREGKPVPEQGFVDSLILDLHGIPVCCYYLGGGHTADNIAVWLPQQQILFAGCMVKDSSANVLGNISEAVMEEWPATIDRIATRFPDVRIVVPGHGACGGAELLRHTQKLIEAKSTFSKEK